MVETRGRAAYEGGIEQAYQGLLESVRRVDNFPKPKTKSSRLSVDNILEMIDNKLSEYRQDYELLTEDSHDLEIGAIVGYIEALDSLKRNILN